MVGRTTLGLSQLTCQSVKFGGKISYLVRDLDSFVNLTLRNVFESDKTENTHKDCIKFRTLLNFNGYHLFVKRKKT